MGMSEQPEVEKVVIIGSGIAGLTAGIYAARADLRPLIIEGMEPGGQLTLTTLVENFPGFPEGIDGPELVDRMRRQAERFGARYLSGEVEEVDLSSRPFTVKLMGEDPIRTHTLIIASGARARMLGLPEEAELVGHGLSTCAVCDGAFFRDKRVVLVGGGDTAMEDAIYLTRYAREVFVVHRRDTLRASKIMQQRAREKEKIRFIWNTEVRRILGSKAEGVKGVVLYHKDTGLEETFPCDGVFLAIGHIPNTEMVKGQLPLDENGYILADGVRTTVPGVFAAGDVADRQYQQAVTAAGTGCQAALEAEAYLAEHGLT